MNVDPTIVRPAKPEEWPEVADILADAFADDPVLNWIGRHPGYAQYSFDLTLSAFGKEEGVLIDESRQAACLFIRPNRTFPNVIRLSAVFQGLRQFGIAPLWRGLNFLRTIEKLHYQPPHVYIFAIGCRRSAQGKGLGAAMMKQVITRETPEGVPLYLENSNPRNEPFYQKFGFVNQQAFHPGKDGPLMKTMLRLPD